MRFKSFKIYEKINLILIRSTNLFEKMLNINEISGRMLNLSKLSGRSKLSL